MDPNLLTLAIGFTFITPWQVLVFLRWTVMERFILPADGTELFSIQGRYISLAESVSLFRPAYWAVNLMSRLL